MNETEDKKYIRVYIDDFGAGVYKSYRCFAWNRFLKAFPTSRKRYNSGDIKLVKQTLATKAYQKHAASQAIVVREDATADSNALATMWLNAKNGEGTLNINDNARYERGNHPFVNWLLKNVVD